MSDEARINGEVRMMKDRRFDFDISSVPSTFVIRRTTNSWDCAAKCKIDMAGQRPTAGVPSSPSWSRDT